MAVDDDKPAGVEAPIVDDEIVEVAAQSPAWLKLAYLGGSAFVLILALFLATYFLLKPSSKVASPVVASKVSQHSQNPEPASTAAMQAAQDLEIRVNHLRAELALLNKQKQALPPTVNSPEEATSQGGDCLLTGNADTRKAELRRCLGLKDQTTAAEKAAPPMWQYVGANGPENWRHLDPAYILCDTGENQSPINMVGQFPETSSELHFNYRPGLLSVVNNGHTIQVNVVDGGGVEYAGIFYSLQQIVFHAPSEELMDGRPADMSLQMIHAAPDKGTLIVAVRLNRGAENKMLAPIFNVLPPLPNKEYAVKQADWDPDDMLPKLRAFYYYQGSLTTPPCTENVNWIVMQQAISLSAQQYQTFVAMYAYNARPVQKINGRKIFQHR